MFVEDIVNSVYLELQQQPLFNWVGRSAKHEHYLVQWQYGHVDSECYFVFLYEL